MRRQTLAEAQGHLRLFAAFAGRTGPVARQKIPSHWGVPTKNPETVGSVPPFSYTFNTLSPIGIYLNAVRG